MLGTSPPACFCLLLNDPPSLLNKHTFWMTPKLRDVCEKVIATYSRFYFLRLFLLNLEYCHSAILVMWTDFFA